MAGAATTETSPDAPSALPQNTQDPPTGGTTIRKSRVTGFLKPDCTRKRRRSGEESIPTPATPPTSEASATPTSPKYSVSPPTLTAAQALLDQRKQKLLQESVSYRQTSPNTARTALLALQGKQMVSQKDSEDALKSAKSTAEPTSTAAPAIQQARAPHVGVPQMQQNATPSSSTGAAEEKTATTVMDGGRGPVASPGRMDEEGVGNDEDPQVHAGPQRPRRQESDPGESRSDKALTYPGPLPNLSQTDRRRNTHSGFGRDSESKSPSSTKKHQCEFLCSRQ